MNDGSEHRERMSEAVNNPILNSPYERPTRHLVVGPHGPTGDVAEGRRASESFIPIAQAKKGATVRDIDQDTLDFDLTGERRERNGLINDLRRDVELWRQRDYHGATPTTRNLLQHWADEHRENRVLYAQREAAETAIFCAEVAGRHGYRDWRRELDQHNADHNSGLPRVALKMATGAGKTVVMAMLIAWQTLNKVASPRDARFTRRFLVVAPGITIRDRLRVLLPEDAENYYDRRDLVPADLRGTLAQAQIVIVNYHAFLARDAKEIRGVAANTRKLLRAGKSEDPFRETPDMMVSRVLRDLGGVGASSRAGEIVVFNDEAHHCYANRPIVKSDENSLGRLSKDEKEANKEARVWFRGLQAVARSVGIKTVYDLSATPYYLRGSGYNEGYIFPWTVSDFSLMDAIESGIVKIPRTPVDDNATGELVTYLRLWDHIGDKLPKRKSATTVKDWLPPELEGALQSLYTSYKRSFEHWESTLAESGEPPPVFIVVCPNTVVSKMVYDWIGGGPPADDAPDGAAPRPGKLGLLSNVRDSTLLAKPRTVLIDSAQLESGEPLSKDFKAAASAEIATFKEEYRRRNPGADVEALTDEDLLREVMNTVGKRGRLGADVRCVVSVAMLTEGWDANTVTHILGVRAFSSQLLCEQVVGRGLRRRAYEVDEEGRFEPEYANIYGVPFAFIPTDRPMPEVQPKPPALHVQSVEGREDLRISFPRLDGYRLEIPDSIPYFDADTAESFEIGPSTVPTWTESVGVVGAAERVADRNVHDIREQEVAFELARRMLRHPFFNLEGDIRPWLFPTLVAISRRWLAQCVTVHEGFSIGYLLQYAEWRETAVEAILRSVSVQQNNRRTLVRPILRRFEPVGSTASVSFLTRKAAIPATRSEVSHVVLDGPGGNTWEQILALECERADSPVAAYVKNDRLGFAIPYVHKGITHSYLPDFLIRLRRLPGEVFDRTLIVEVTGGRKQTQSPGPTTTKAETARNQWCPAVNNHGGFGRWGYVEITSMLDVRERLAEAFDALYADAPIIGDPSLLDYSDRALSRSLAKGGQRRGA